MTRYYEAGWRGQCMKFSIEMVLNYISNFMRESVGLFMG